MEEGERKRLNELCSMLSNETNRDRFSSLVDELNELLGAEEDRLADSPPFA